MMSDRVSFGGRAEDLQHVLTDGWVVGLEVALHQIIDGVLVGHVNEDLGLVVQPRALE